MWKVIMHGFGVGLGCTLGIFVWEATHNHQWTIACDNALWAWVGIIALTLSLYVHQKRGTITIR